MTYFQVDIPPLNRGNVQRRYFDVIFSFVSAVSHSIIQFFPLFKHFALMYMKDADGHAAPVSLDLFD